MRPAVVALLLAVAGCSAGGLPIAAPPVGDPATPRYASTHQAEAEWYTVATTLRDAVKLAFGGMLRVPAGDVTPQSMAGAYPNEIGPGTLTLSGGAEPAGESDETLRLALALDNYLPKLHSSVEGDADEPLSSTDEPPRLVLHMTGMPAHPLDAFGELDGTFDGHLTVLSGALAGDIELHLTLASLMQVGSDGTTSYYMLRIVGVMYSPAYGPYTNDQHF